MKPDLKNKILSGIVFFVFCLGPLAQADEPLLICKNKKIVRTVRITKEKGLCKTNYTKDGKTQMIGSGMNPASCQKVLEGVRKNLEASHWTCRDVKASSVSDVEEAIKK